MESQHHSGDILDNNNNEIELCNFNAISILLEL